SCEPPFWGRRGHPRPDEYSGFRRTELGLPHKPKSIFQIGGAGAVGTGSIRGMPLLLKLHESGFGIWPFTAPNRRPTVVEIYPRLLTGPVRKSNAAARERLLCDRFPHLSDSHRQLAIGSEDAFDATVSALVMIHHAADLAALAPEADSALKLEGRIWHPGWREQRL